MSGPIEFVFVLSAAKAAVLLAAHVAQQQSREQARKARLETQRERARLAAQEAAKRRAINMRQLAQAKVQAQQARATALAAQEVDAAAKSTQPMPASSEPSELHSLPTPRAPNAEIASEAAAAIPPAMEQVDITPLLQELHGWQTELDADESVGFYQTAECALWREQFGHWLDSHAAGGDSVLLQTRSNELLQGAQAIYKQAGELRERFATRNALLADMISSLQEIGFFVDDPYFEDSADPSGAVLLRATRGSETMEAKVDLSETIRSVWNGIPEEQCQDKFFQYVEQLQQKGVTITATKADFQDRPQLKQHGAKELPQSQPRQKEHT